MGFVPGTSWCPAYHQEWPLSTAPPPKPSKKRTVVQNSAWIRERERTPACPCPAPPALLQVTTTHPGTGSAQPRARTQLPQLVPQRLQPELAQRLLGAAEGHLCPLPAVPSTPLHTVHCGDTLSRQSAGGGVHARLHPCSQLFTLSPAHQPSTPRTLQAPEPPRGLPGSSFGAPVKA